MYSSKLYSNYVDEHFLLKSGFPVVKGRLVCKVGKNIQNFYVKNFFLSVLNRAQSTDGTSHKVGQEIHATK